MRIKVSFKDWIEAARQLAGAINANEVLRPFSTVKTVTASTTAGEENTLLVDSTGGAVTITLPPAAYATCAYFVKKIDASANAVTVDGYGSETIDGAANVSTTTRWAAWRLVSNGSNWYLF